MIGKLKPYILHLRPRMFPMIFLQIVSGLIIGYLISSSVELNILTILVGIFSYVVLLSGGTLALNSFYDKDKGDIGWLNNPPKVPKYLHLYSLALMILGLIVAYLINYRFFIAYFIYFLLSILYSVPPFRWKEKAGFDAFVNAMGYGVLTMYAGYALLDLSLSMTMTLVLLIEFMMWGAGFPLTQLYQYKEDKENKYKTLSLILGRKNVFTYSFVLLFVSMLIIIFSVWCGYFSKAMIIIMFPLYVYIIVFLLKWRKNSMSIDEKSNMYRAADMMSLYNLFLIIGFLF